MSMNPLSGIVGLFFLATLMPVSAQSTSANTLQHPKDQIALQLGAIQMGYTTAGTAFQLVTGNATNAQQAANALVMGKNALDATVAKPALKVQGVVDSPSVDTVEYRDQLYSAVEYVVTSPAAGAIRSLVTLEGGKKVVAVARLVAPPNSWTIPVPYALEARSSADVEALLGNLTSTVSTVNGLSANLTNLSTQVASIGGNLSNTAATVAVLSQNITAVNSSLSSLSGNEVADLKSLLISSGLIGNYSINCTVTTLAGSGSEGSVDGTGIAASFKYPKGVAVDSIGNVYAADQGNHKIRKITSIGVVSTLAGSGAGGSVDGTGIAASFYYPKGVAVDSIGNVYVADGGNKIRKITPSGVVSTLAGSGSEGSVDGTGIAARFSYPQGVAVDSIGNVYVACNGNHKIRKITPSGVVTTLAGSGSLGSVDGTGIAASFIYPMCVAVDSIGNVYVADGGNKIRKITPQ